MGESGGATATASQATFATGEREADNERDEARRLLGRRVAKKEDGEAKGVSDLS